MTNTYNYKYGTLQAKRDTMLWIQFTTEEQQVLIWSLKFHLGALVVYDITDVDSFKKVGVWLKELNSYLEPNTPILIAGNKCDVHNR